MIFKHPAAIGRAAVSFSRQFRRVLSRDGFEPVCRSARSGHRTRDSRNSQHDARRSVRATQCCAYRCRTGYPPGHHAQEPDATGVGAPPGQPALATRRGAIRSVSRIAPADQCRPGRRRSHPACRRRHMLVRRPPHQPGRAFSIIHQQHEDHVHSQRRTSKKPGQVKPGKQDSPVRKPRIIKTGKPSPNISFYLPM